MILALFLKGRVQMELVEPIWVDCKSCNGTGFVWEIVNGEKCEFKIEKP